jgi:CheY-like chemotaxis protein
MTGLSRKLGALAVLFALVTPGALAQDIQSMFDEGVDLLNRGKDDEALQAFQKVLAADPSHDQAYELFKSTEHDVWIQILTKEGDFELVAKRLMGLARMGRVEKRNDGDAIRALVPQLNTEDVLTRRTAIRQLAAEHGEYAVPYMLGSVANQNDEDRRVSVMQALTEMNTDVVLPLIEACDSPDAFLRRNVALVLGYIGDARAAGVLGQLAEGDADEGVQDAARQSLGKLEGAGGVGSLLQAGEDYHLQRDNVLADYQYSDVVWTWGENGLESSEIARSLYPDEMAKKSYRRALAIDANSAGARAGLARAYASQMATAAALAESGEGEAAAAVYSDALPMMLCGADAVEAALVASVQQNDYATAGVLCHVVGHMADAPTDGLRAAINTGDAALASEASIAAGGMCLVGKARADADLVAALANVAGRATVRLAMVIDADEARAGALASALAGHGVDVSVASSGAHGLGLLRRVAGIDAVIIADRLPDLTAHQVMDEVKAGSRTASTPILIVADDAAAAGELFGDTTVIAAGDAGAVVEAMGDKNAGRARADALAAQAAGILAGLASGGQDIGAAADALAGSLAGRPDSVVAPSARALAIGGNAGHAGSLLAVLSDTNRSDESRAACGFAAAAIFQRGGGSADSAELLMGVAHSDAALEVRKAAVAALGSLDLTPAQRAELLTSAGGAQH